MSYQQKVVLYTIGFPITCSTAVMLFFNYQFFQFKSVSIIGKLPMWVKFYES